MAKPSKAVLEFMEQYNVASDEIWDCHGTWVIYHKALERVAAEQGIVFGEPKYLPDSDVKQGFVSILVKARLGDREDWAFGEANPKNCKTMGYPVAMASKRARDRAVLQLLNTQGELYSEEEADEFKRPSAEAGDDLPPEMNILPRDESVQVLTVDAQRGVFSELEKEMVSCDTVEMLKRWKRAARLRASRLSDHWRGELEARYLTKLREIEKRDALEYQERMTG